MLHMYFIKHSWSAEKMLASIKTNEAINISELSQERLTPMLFFRLTEIICIKLLPPSGT